MFWNLREELNNLVDQIESNCLVEEYINGEDDVPICMQYDDDWEDHFFSELSSSQPESDLDEEEGQFDLEGSPKITKFQDAISSLEIVQTFLDSRGYSEEATRIASSVNELTYLHCASLESARQSTIEEFFHSAAYFLFLFLKYLIITNYNDFEKKPLR